MKPSSFLSKKLSPALQVFYRPMLVISLGLHSLFLLAPISSEPKPEPEPTQKEESVKISSLVAPSSEPTPKASPKTTPTPKATKPTPETAPKKLVSTPQPQSAPPPLTLPVQKVKQEQPQEPKQLEKEKQEEQLQEKQQAQNQKEEQPPEDNQTNKEPPEDNQKELQEDNQTDEQLQNDNLAQVENSGRGLLQELSPRIRKDLVENSSNSPETIDEVLRSKPYSEIAAGQREYFFQGEGELKEGSIGSLGISQRNPTTSYYNYIQPVLTNELGFEIEELGKEYGNAELYKAKNAENVEFYMSLVPFGSFDSQTFVVIWAKDPRTIE